MELPGEVKPSSIKYPDLSKLKLIEKSWIERNPFWFGIIMLFIGAILTESIHQTVEYMLHKEAQKQIQPTKTK